MNSCGHSADGLSVYKIMSKIFCSMISLFPIIQTSRVVFTPYCEVNFRNGYGKFIIVGRPVCTLIAYFYG